MIAWLKRLFAALFSAGRQYLAQQEIAAARADEAKAAAELQRRIDDAPKTLDTPDAATRRNDPNRWLSQSPKAGPDATGGRVRDATDVPPGPASGVHDDPH